MKYCRYCGNPLEDEDTFCEKCGKFTKRKNDVRFYGTAADTVNEPKEKLLCELAYTGVLFWLPLFVLGKNKDAKYHANQGLWVLILSCLLCWCIGIAGVLRIILPGTLGDIFGVVYMAVFFAAALGLLYLAVQCVLKALAIHKGEQPTSILFLESRAIIK